MSQREIKYRAWDIVTLAMLRVTFIDFVNGTVGVITDEDRGMSSVLNPGESILMEYTGLMDRNGKEICDGDIIRLPLLGNRTGMAEVKYSVSGWWAVCDYAATRRLHPANIQSEIIGNIHENPELLEKT